MPRLSLPFAFPFFLRGDVLVDASCNKLIWDVDKSSNVNTDGLPIVRGDKGLPEMRYSRGKNGNATNIYGGKGKMPHFRGTTAINGGLPQLGNLPLHLWLLKRDLRAIFQGNLDYEGYCLLDYEHWRADWNSTSWSYREKSIANANGDLEKAVQDYESATRLFMEETIKATRETIPGCKVGWYGYPRNNLPLPASITQSVSWKNWCRFHQDKTSPSGYPDGRSCWFEDSGYDGPFAEEQRQINNNLSWLFELVDFIAPSVYLGYEGHAAELAESYVRSTVEEARRLADVAGNTTGKVPEVVPITWARYNDRKYVRNYLSYADTKIQHLVPLKSGADKILMWGAVSDKGTENDREGTLQNWLNTVFAEAVDDIEGTCIYEATHSTNAQGDAENSQMVDTMPRLI